jgi:ferredoxin
MASKDENLGHNVPGRFQVNPEECIDCDLCRDIAPEFFARDDNGYSKIFRQPASQADIETCTEAMDSCPVNAIRDKGE